MTESMKVAIILASGAVLASVIAAAAAIVAAVKSHTNSESIHAIHLELNSRLQELIDASRKAGQVEERDNQRQVEKRAEVAAKTASTTTIINQP